MRKTPKVAKQKKLSRVRKPEEMSLEQWQVELRRQFGREQKLRLRNVGEGPLFSDYEVANPATRRIYRVAIRGSAAGENYCSCPDFAVNTLGTCKHIEFALERLGRRPGAKRALALGFQPPYGEVYVQYGAERHVVFRPGANCPERLRQLAARWFDDSGRLRPERYADFHVFLHKASETGHELRCYDDTLALVAQVRDRALLREKIAAAFPRGPRSAAWKGLVQAQLYPYQREGAMFAAQAGRSLLADDMGLGKTIQAIAAAEILARHAGIERVLIVCPTSLKHQWKTEIEKFTGRDALVVEGLLPRRTALYAQPAFFKITNYDVICRDLDAIHRWQPDLIVLDEAQRIKNWKTRTAQSVKRLQSQYAIVLTGTPLENRLEELHSIIEFVDRFHLGPLFRFLHEHQQVDETGRVVGYRRLSEISRTLAPILLRRTKDKVLHDLPERLEKRFFVSMTPEQLKHHNENKEIVAGLVQKWRRFGFLSEADQLRLHMALQNMRMSCDSTYLLDKKTDCGVKADELATLLGEMLEDPQTKVVIFSQWLRMHELIVRRLAARKWEHVLFHGGVPGRQRKELVQRFREDPRCRLFLATDAGGVGLNLQHASAVVNVDLPWNPAVLEQRIGRVHRLGQHRPVRVVHFVAENSIEHSMLDVLAFKKSLFAGALDGGQDEVFLGGTRLKKFMESVEQVSGDIAATPSGNGAGPSPLAGDSGEASPGRRAGGRRGQREQEQAPPQPAAPTADRPSELLAEVLASGVQLLDRLGRALGAGRGGASGESAAAPTMAAAARLVERDPQTGQSFVRLPLPEPDMLEKALGLLRSLLGG